MPYVIRDEKGNIIELFDTFKTGEEQWLEPDSEEIVMFLKMLQTSKRAKSSLIRTDNDMARVVDDLIDILMKKQVFTFTELPEAVQSKLNDRRKSRKDMNYLSNLISDDDTIF